MGVVGTGQDVRSIAEGAGLTLEITPKQVARGLAAIILGLAAAHAATQFSKHVLGRGTLVGLVDLFYLDEEASIPTWYSSAALFACAGVLALNAVASARSSNRDWVGWAGLAAVFLYASADEVAMIHERLFVSVMVHYVPEALDLRRFTYHPWLVVGIPLAGMIGVLFLRFVLRLPARTRVRFLIAGCLYFGGAIGVEVLNGHYTSRYGKEDLSYAMLVMLEEVLEMAGVGLFLYALVCHLDQRTGGGGAQVHFRSSRQRKHFINDNIMMNC